MSETNPAVSLDGDDLGMSAEDTAAFEAMAKGEGAQEQPPEPQPEAEPEPAIEDEAEPGAEGEQPPGRGYVSQKALHAERMRRKEIEKRERELSEKNAVLSDRLNLILQRLSPQDQQPQDADPEPDPNVDLIAHHEWLKRQVGQIKEAEAARQRQAQEAQTAQTIERGIFDRWQNDSKAFQASQPDTPKATEWLVTTRDRQLQAMANVDPRYADARVREAQIKAELQQIVIAAAKAGRNAAETVYNLARGWGYTSEQASAAARQEPPTSERLRNIAEAQGAAKSLSGAGSRGAAAMSAEALAAMSGAEQEAWLADPANDAAFRRMMGG